MNQRTTYVMMGIVGILLLVLGYYAFFQDSKNLPPEGVLLEALNTGGTKPKDITTLEIEKNGEKTVFVRQPDGRWKITSPTTDRADSALIERIVAEVLTAKRAEQDAEVTENLALHGLDKPTVKITLKKGDKAGTLSLGKVGIGGVQAVVYVMSSDHPGKAQAVRKELVRSLFKTKPVPSEETAAMVVDMDDYRLKRLLGDGLDDPISQIKRITVSRGKDKVILVRNTTTRTWEFEEPRGYGEAQLEVTGAVNPMLIGSVRELLNSAASISVADAADFIDDVSEGYSKFGVEASDALVTKVTIERTDDKAESEGETLYLGKQVDEKGRDLVYARFDGSDAVVKVNAERPRALQRLLTDLTPLRDKSFLRANPKRVDAIDIDVGGSKFELRRGESTWTVYSPDGRSAVANMQALNTLMGSLSQRDVVRGFPPTTAKDDAMGFKKPAVEIKIWEDGILKSDKPDPKAKPRVSADPTYRVLFGMKDVGDVVFARRYIGTAKADVKLSESLLTLAMKPRMEYLEVSMKGFPIDQAVKVAFTRGGEVYEISRDAKDDGPASTGKWTIQSPAGKKGKTADIHKVISLLAQAANLQPLKITTDDPRPDQLATLALTTETPKGKLTVTLRDDPKPRVYFFGNEAGEKKESLYTRVDDSLTVFEIPRKIWDEIQTGEVQDLVVYRMEISKLKGIKLRGWADIVGEPATRELEKKEGIWTLKGGTYTIDPILVENFLLDLLTPKAEAIIAGGPKPEHKLDVKAGALELEFDLGDGKPIQLTIGGPDPTGRFAYATSNQSPGEVFTLLKDRFKTVREKPAVFKEEKKEK